VVDASSPEPASPPTFRLLPVVTLVTLLGLVATAAGTWLALDAARDEADSATRAQLETAGGAIERQVSRYAETLYGLRAAFALDPSLSRVEFRELVGLDALTRRNPGAQAITFNRALAARDVASFEARSRKELPGLTVHPVSDRPLRVVIDYVEPLGGNRSTLGFDLMSDPARREAVELARDTGDLTATSPLTLVQRGSGEGFLLVLAAYDDAPPPVTAPSRRRHFLGALVAAFDAEQLLREALDTSGSGVAIYDAGPTVATPREEPGDHDRLIGDPQRGAPSRDVNVGTRRWRLVATDPVEARLAVPVSVGVSGGALVLLVAGTLAALASSRRRALALAGAMTADLRTSQESLRIANDELREADRLKDVFLSTVSHELRTPLTAIAGVSDLLMRKHDSLSPDLREELVAGLDANVRNLRALIDELLDFTRLQADPGMPLLGPVDVEELAHRVTRELQPLLEAHQVTVASDDHVVALANPQALHRVVTNLLANAAKYSPAGGLVSVHVMGRGGSVLLSVLDEGPGIPEEERQRVFERFYRGAGDAELRQPGTGIGLAVVKELCTRMHASVSIGEAPGGGAAFHVRLPAAPRERPQTAT
jgi:signal transduction histidine kinase